MPPLKSGDVLEISQEEIPDLIKAVEDAPLSSRHKTIVLTLIQQMGDIKRTRQEKISSLKRIKRMLGKQTEKSKKRSDSEEDCPEKENHGRNGVDDYTFATVVSHPHEELKQGCPCPLCAHGTLQLMEPRKIIKLKGQASVIAELHQPERLRCSGCGEVLTAELPPEIGEEKADASANALVAFFRFGMGIPHYRLAAIQNAMGVPLPASTQYEMVEVLWTHVLPIYNELLNYAANSPLLYVDDTKAKILELLKNKEERKAAGERVGIFSTGIVAKKDGHDVHLFFTGTKHAGENLDGLLTRRTKDLPPPMEVTDGLSRNVPKNHLTCLVLCLVHARRYFFDCLEAFPDESTYVIERIGKVYHNEKHIQQSGMDAQKRLEYHQTNSEKPMEEIKIYAEQKMNSKEVEDNSNLGVAFKYLLKFWTGLTQFLRILGAPLDNNEVERLIKKFIQLRKNSLFYKNENGAHVGDVMMSLIQTAIAAETNPFEYLTCLQRYSKHVAKNPHLWLPWNYKNILKSVQPPKPG